MKSSAKGIKLASVDELFSSEESRADAARERVVELPLAELHPFKDHPFKVRDDESLAETVESIKEFGVLVPGIARPLPDGGYEIVAGHRRHLASQRAGKTTMPFIVRDLDDDEAIIIMVDSNLQRENIDPSEKAKAFKMKLDAMQRKRGRPSIKNSGQIGQNFSAKGARDELASQVGENSRNIQRYIRLNELIPPLLDMVDNGKIGLNPAEQLSYLPPDQQTMLLDAMDSEQATPNLSQAQRLKKASQDGSLTMDSMRKVMGEEKKSDMDKITLDADTLHKYFPRSYTPQKMLSVILKLLDNWRKRQRTQER